MSLSLVTVPLLLDTNTQVDHLLRQWLQLFHNGHMIMPTTSVATFFVYLYVVFNKRSSGRSWTGYAVAGAVTVGMIPFTLIVMVSTNNTLFALVDAINDATQVTSLEYVKELVTRWSWMHVVRSLFPLFGSILGFNVLLKDLAA